jgi:hypothetical protein
MSNLIIFIHGLNDIDAILRGANPGNIPYYLASKFDLSINLDREGAWTCCTLDALGQRRRGNRTERSATSGFGTKLPC